VPRQNRVTPFGSIIVTPERGTFMGNRGVLHDEEGRIQRAWQVRRWIVCLLAFKGRERAVMTPGHDTEHRPCAECSRERFNAFRTAWRAAHGASGSKLPTAAEIDNRLHAERVAPGGSKRSHTAALDELPDGVLVKLEDDAFLVRGEALLRWSPGGYTESRPQPPGKQVTALTPQSTVAAIRAGYVPDAHGSAGPAR
jgi:hypothetical protein